MSEQTRYPVEIKSIDHVTHDTLRIVTTKPENYSFSPGQATDVAINKKGEREDKRPFTMTSLPEQDHLEFIIKTYPSHDGLTDKLLDLQAGDELVLYEVFGTIAYKGEGLFIAGGSGITPFIAILRDLHKKNALGNNKLIFANKKKEDIILKDELESLLDSQFINILSSEKHGTYTHGYVTKDFLKQHLSSNEQFIYLCGPEAMMKSVEKHLDSLGVPKDKIIKEGW